MKNPPEAIRRVGLVANTEKAESRPLVTQAVQLLTGHGLEVIMDDATARACRIRVPRQGRTAKVAANSDLVMVFGGDGTILRVAREMAGSRTPLLGIHLGRLGFLAEVTADRLPQAIDLIVRGDFTVEPRSIIQAERGRRAPIRALNDIVFSRGEVSRIIELEVSVDGEELTCYRCDGLIVSSPTGSTAYSLAAGGAIVSPKAAVFTITPICPLALSNRSVIVNLESTIRVRACSRDLRTHLTADGQVAMELRPNDEVVIRQCPDQVHLLRLRGSSFFKTLRQKLHWSGSHT